jgi:hypothetical protein
MIPIWERFDLMVAFGFLGFPLWENKKYNEISE